MWVKDLKTCREFVAGDGSRLREVFNPRRQRLSLGYSLAWARVPPRRATKPHRLVSSEVYVILAGGGVMHIDRGAKKVRSGEVVYIPPRSRQWIENTGRGELRFLCIVDPAWRAEDEEVSA